MLMRRVIGGTAQRSRTKTSSRPLLSPAARLVASDEKVTAQPSPEIAGRELPASPCVPAELTLTSSVTPVARSCRKI